MPVNIDEALYEWAKTNPFLTDRLIFYFLGGNNGACSITQVSRKAVKTYINGDTVNELVFAFQIMFTISENADTTNTENMFTLRKWQAWIDLQEKAKSYPDFGSGCSAYRLENLDEGSPLAVRYDNNMAKYQFFAKLTYKQAA